MNLTLKETEATNNGLDLFKDPFEKGNVTSIYFYILKDRWGGDDVTMSSKVEFKNGDTKGEQNIKADDFDTLVRKTKDFIDSL